MRLWVLKPLKNFLQILIWIKEVELLKEELKSAQGQRRTRAIKRLEVIEAFRGLRE